MQGIAQFLTIVVYICLAYGVNSLIIYPLLGLIFGLIGIAGTVAAGIIAVVVSVIVLYAIADYLYMASVVIVGFLQQTFKFAAGRA